jgi:hypothetical protein
LQCRTTPVLFLIPAWNVCCNNCNGGPLTLSNNQGGFQSASCGILVALCQFGGS